MKYRIAVRSYFLYSAPEVYQSFGMYDIAEAMETAARMRNTEFCIGNDVWLVPV